MLVHIVRLLICVAAFCSAGVHCSYGYQQQPPSYTTAKPYYTTPAAYYTTQKAAYYPSTSYYTTAKPYYSTAAPYYSTTAKPYYPVTTYPTTAYYSTTYPTTSYYTTNQPTTYYQPTTTYATTAYYQEPSTYATTQAYYQPAYSTPGYYPDNYEGNDNGWYNYAFKFNVNGYDGNEQSRSETHENSMTKGKYTVNLPDGRKQIVTYEADQNGYRAEVSYEAAGSDNSDGGNYYSTAKYEYGSSAGNYDTYQTTTPTYNQQPSASIW